MLNLNNQLAAYNNWMNSYYFDLLFKVVMALSSKPGITANYERIEAYRNQACRKFLAVMAIEGVSISLRFNVAGNSVIAELPSVLRHAYQTKLKEGVEYTSPDYYSAHNWENDYDRPPQEWGNILYLAKSKKDTDELYDQIRIKHAKFVKDLAKVKAMFEKTGTPFAERNIVSPV